ncbi:Eukaryotic peptide chain release factor subunit 1-3, partial [Cucurbita argyrosperma subsp. sororia]
MVLQNDIDLLNPPAELEKRKHKLKRLVQSPNSFFMDVKCQGCFNITTVFSHSQTVVVCGNCQTVLCQPTGGRARLTEGSSLSRTHIAAASFSLEHPSPPYSHFITMADGHETDKNIEIWKIKKLIKALEAARGNGTSMISLIMPPRDQISRVTKMLGDEFGTASNIKSRVNRQSVLGAITSAQQRLKLYNKVPPNGLVLYTGTIVTEDGKEKKVTIDFEPFRPINASLYLCDNKFHTEALNELLESDDKFGFIVMDGNGTLFGTLSGNTREVLHKFSVDLPKKHGRGGQSALRFARLRMEKRHNYVRKTAELATQFYINPATSQPNVAGLILAGSADFKTELSQSDMFDPRLQAKILNVVDVSYGGENGFNQAIELSSEILSNVKFIQEKRLIGKYFEEISQDTGKYVFGVDDTLKALEMGAVEILIVWENLDINRYVLKNVSTGEVIIKHLNKEQEANQSNFRDPVTAAELEVQEKMALLEWFANEYKKFGCTLEFVTNKSQEGSQFCRGFGGIGGILRYQLDIRSFDELSDGEEYGDSE